MAFRIEDTVPEAVPDYSEEHFPDYLHRSDSDSDSKSYLLTNQLYICYDTLKRSRRVLQKSAD